MENNEYFQLTKYQLSFLEVFLKKKFNLMKMQHKKQHSKVKYVITKFHYKYMLEKT